METIITMHSFSSKLSDFSSINFDLERTILDLHAMFKWVSLETLSHTTKFSLVILQYSHGGGETLHEESATLNDVENDSILHIKKPVYQSLLLRLLQSP